MDWIELAGKSVMEECKKEIERAVEQVKQPKRTALDRWFRREWHRAAAVSEWPEWRRERYWEWKRRKSRSTGETRDLLVEGPAGGNRGW